MKRLLVLVAVVSCGGPAVPARTPAQRDAANAAATGAVTALQASRFDDATRQAGAVLARDPGNARAAAVRAIASYVVASHGLLEELRGIIGKADRLEFFDH